MDQLVLVLVLLWSSELQTAGRSDPGADVRLVGGGGPCAGALQVKTDGDWRQMGGIFSYWSLQSAAVACEQLGCGSAVSTGIRKHTSHTSVWRFDSECVQSGSALSICVRTKSQASSDVLEVTCSDSVRLVNGTSLCSGRLEVKSDQSWSSVCEADFDQQDAEVVCRELGCGAPSVLQGALYGEVEAPMWTKEFQCGGHESALLDCRRSDSARRTCSPGKAVGLTCSDPADVRLEGELCNGILQMKLNHSWRPVYDSDWTLKSAAETCRQLKCGNAVATGSSQYPSIDVWWISSECVRSGSALRECVRAGPWTSSSVLEIICLDELFPQPIISVRSSVDGVSGAQQQGFQLSRGSSFSISCSVQPRYAGGSFQLTFTSSNTTHSYTEAAGNHSADFLFPAAEPAHQGSYSCVYSVSVSSHNFSISSQLLSLTVSGAAGAAWSRLLVVLLVLLPIITGLVLYRKASRGQKQNLQPDMELQDYQPAEGSAEEEAAE
ncbi:scavenger receptor cysteine-rich type 1 protein M130-like [Scomber scombrus]|uniref:scavenger receptor cysteine-rich type 1 protein M130-like n=1 Tax=Scomber scombrus TaxID=13677 RepID=UPI002DDA38A3|nr:scavenger receptor cysteine-rich type 1 protein M130-like [Scomber scombrus]